MEGEWSKPRPGRFTPWKEPVPTAQKAGRAPGAVWMSAENHALTGIRSPKRPARNESLYRLSYPGPDTCSSIKRKPNTQNLYSFIYLIVINNNLYGYTGGEGVT